GVQNLRGGVGESENHVVVEGVGVADAELEASGGENGVVRLAGEDAANGFRAVVVEDDELFAFGRGEAHIHGQGGVAENIGASHVQLVVARAGSRAVQFNGKDRPGIQHYIAAGQD